MARKEARLSVSIWEDEDFLALSPSAQRMFMFLLSQRDLAHDGVIALRERRWSKSAAGLTVAQIRKDLAELSTARFVVVDEDTEELLVRTLIRRDKVYRQPNVLHAAADHLAVVSSRAILAAVAMELDRIVRTEEVPKGSEKAMADMVAIAAKGSGNPSPDPSGKGSGDRNGADHDEADIGDDRSDVSAGNKGSGNPSANPSGNPSRGTPGERGVVTAVSSASPFPGSPSPVPLPARTAIEGEVVDPADVALFAVPAGTDLEVAEPSNAGQLNRQWIDFCSAKNLKLSTAVIKRYGGKIKQALDDGFSVGLVKRALAAMLEDRVASRPALLDSYLVRVQQGPELPPQRLSQHQADAARRAPEGVNPAERLYDTLTRPA